MASSDKKRSERLKNIKFKPVKMSSAFTDDESLRFDLLSQLTYMSCICKAGADRTQVFEATGVQSFRTVQPFRQAYDLFKQLGTSHARALTLVSTRIKVAAINRLLLRFAASLSAGEQTEGFLEAERRDTLETYVDQYERHLESLRKWTDAYSAILVSVALIIVVGLLSNMIGPFGDVFLYALAVAGVAGLGFGSYPIKRALPGDTMLYTTPDWPCPPVRRRAGMLIRVLLPLGVLLGIVCGYMMGQGIGWIVFGLCLLPPGIYGYRDDGAVAARDVAIGASIRNMGAIMGALGVTPAKALEKVDKQSMGVLTNEFQRLQSRLAYNLPGEMCWSKFMAETGSEMIRRTIRAFVDATSRGADALHIGELTGGLALTISLLRRKRAGVVTTFTYLLFPMHMVMVVLVIFIQQVTTRFNSAIGESFASMDVSGAGGSVAGVVPTLPWFNMQDPTPPLIISSVAVVSMTLMNGFTLWCARGGNRVTMAFFIGIMAVLSGLAFKVVPTVVEMAMNI